jgi:hypothetical protein
VKTLTQGQVEVLGHSVQIDQPICIIAEGMGLSFMEVLSQIAAHEITPPSHPGPPPKVPRGKGYSKSQVESAHRAMLAFDGTIIQWARSQGLNPDLLALAMEQHKIGSAYLLTQLDHGKECSYCTRWYYPSNVSQDFCSKKCGTDARRDMAYFGGNRRNCLGLLAGVCQVCAAKPQKGLSAHHVYGKENDPGDESLIAVCSGCHDLITRLSRRHFGEQPGSWAALISLAEIRGNVSFVPYVNVEVKDGAGVLP